MFIFNSFIFNPSRMSDNWGTNGNKICLTHTAISRPVPSLATAYITAHNSYHSNKAWCYRYRIIFNVSEQISSKSNHASDMLKKVKFPEISEFPESYGRFE